MNTMRMVQEDGKFKIVLDGKRIYWSEDKQRVVDEMQRIISGPTCAGCDAFAYWKPQHTHQYCPVCANFINRVKAEYKNPPAIVNGILYILNPRAKHINPRILGFGGREVEVEYLDGSRASTNDCIYVCPVPKKLRHNYPDTARFIKAP